MPMVIRSEHCRKYEVIARAIGLDVIFNFIPADEEVVERELEDGHDHLNGIPLGHWDQHHQSVMILAHRAGYKSWSKSQSVCLLKHVAQYHFVNRHQTLTIMEQSRE